MSAMREIIRDYLKLKTSLDKAARLVVNEKRSVHATAKQFGLDYEILDRKVNIMKRLYDYFEESLLYNNAVRSVMEKYRTMQEAATLYKISPEIIQEEIDQYYNLVKNGEAKGAYEYDKPLEEGRVFTFKEELSLLQDLNRWKYTYPPCSCLICAMVQLLNLAYQLAKKKNKPCPSSWAAFQQADKNFLICFEMTHSSRISNLYPHYDNNVEELYEACKNKQQPSSWVDEKNDFKVPSSRGLLKRKYKPNKISDEANEAPMQTSHCQRTASAVPQSNSELMKLSLDTPTEWKSNPMVEKEAVKFVTDQFQNVVLDLSKKSNFEIANNDISNKENFEPLEACNQGTSELMNSSLDTQAKWKLEVMIKNETASASFVDDQIKNTSTDKNNVETASHHYNS